MGLENATHSKCLLLSISLALLQSSLFENADGELQRLLRVHEKGFYALTTVRHWHHELFLNFTKGSRDEKNSLPNKTSPMKTKTANRVRPYNYFKITTQVNYRNQLVWNTS